MVHTVGTDGVFLEQSLVFKSLHNDFPGGPVAKSPHSQGRGTSSHMLQLRSGLVKQINILKNKILKKHT